MVLDLTSVVAMKPADVCDVISVVAEFMVGAAGDEASRRAIQ
jgi:hypothetical protein